MYFLTYPSYNTLTSMEKAYKGNKIGVLGLGVEGFVSAAYLKKIGAEVTVLDRKERQEISSETLSNLGELGVQFQLGETYKAHITDFDVIVRSPGVRLTEEETAALSAKQIPITSQTQIFFELCPAPIIGVTGTKGKGTTSTLIYQMLKNSGKDAYLGGNIGLPPLSFLDKLNKESIVVLELSSFQLMDVTISPHIGVMLMVVPEHLDYHSDVHEYIDAKRNIFRFQTPDDYAIVNRDYIASNESDIHSDGTVFYVSRERENDEGAFLQENAVWLRKNGKVQKIIDTEDIRLPGKHNLENVMAAIMAASLAGVEKDQMVTAIQEFSGLEHRLELVKQVAGVKYYDDSFSTTPETAIAAIEAFSEPAILILGGSGKDSDFTELGKVISESSHIRAIIGIGDEWLRIREQIEKSKEPKIIIEGAKDMHTVVQAASKIALPGNIVLLSPGCASFGMFKNYKERGDLFKEAVESLSN